MEGEPVTVWDFIDPVPPGTPSGSEEEAPLAVEIKAKPLPSIPKTKHKLSFRSRAESTMLVCGVLVVKKGDRFVIDLNGKSIKVDSVGSAQGILYYRVGFTVTILVGPEPRVYDLPVDALEYKICIFLGKLRFLVRYPEYTILLYKCRQCPILRLPAVDDFIYEVNDAGLCNPVKRIYDHSVLLFVGSKINIHTKTGKVKKRDLVVRGNTIIWKGTHIVVK